MNHKKELLTTSGPMDKQFAEAERETLNPKPLNPKPKPLSLKINSKPLSDRLEVCRARQVGISTGCSSVNFEDLRPKP